MEYHIPLKSFRVEQCLELEASHAIPYIFLSAVNFICWNLARKLFLIPVIPPLRWQ